MIKKDSSLLVGMTNPYLCHPNLNNLHRRDPV